MQIAARKQWGFLVAVTWSNVLWTLILALVGYFKKDRNDQDFAQWLISATCTMSLNQIKTIAEWWAAIEGESLWQTLFGERRAAVQLAAAGLLPGPSPGPAVIAPAQEAAPRVRIRSALQQQATAARSSPVHNTNIPLVAQTVPANSSIASTSGSSPSTRPSSRTPARVQPSGGRVTPSATGPQVPAPSPPLPRSDATIRRSDGGSDGPTKDGRIDFLPPSRRLLQGQR